MPDFHSEWQSEDGLPDEDNSPSSIPESFDPGYYNDSNGLPQICCDCGELFLLPAICKEGRNREGIFCQYCDPCLDKFFQRRAAAYRENKQIAKRLGMTVEEYYGL